MTFKLPYIAPKSRRGCIELPDFYLGFVSSEDVNQLSAGLMFKNKTYPIPAALKHSVIQLAKQRKEG